MYKSRDNIEGRRQKSPSNLINMSVKLKNNNQFLRTIDIPNMNITKSMLSIHRVNNAESSNI